MSRGHILIVDDDESLLRLLSMRLRSAGYEPSAVESGEQALGRVAARRPDLVITDLRMDGMDGMALFDTLRQRYPSLPVIILTAHGSVQEAVEATKNGVFGFFTKPFDSHALLEYVDKALSLSAIEGEGAPREDWRAEIVTRSSVMEDLLSRTRLVADSDASTLIVGESGTGKELLARAIHKASARAERPFMAVNCGAFPEPLLESELFGHRRGAFTGATRDYTGLLQAASGGTLFLDEIGDMPLALQVKLLRVLQEREVRPVGAAASVPVDVRVISATHRDLDEEVAEGRFREDLYYRLNVVSLEVPPLSERREDIPLLAGHFLEQLARRTGRPVKRFAPEALERLASASWPGNIRQLYNVVEQVVTLSTGSVIADSLVQQALRDRGDTLPSLADARQAFERDYLARVLQMTSGNVTHAARIAKRNRTEFYKLLRRHHLDPTEFKH